MQWFLNQGFVMKLLQVFLLSTLMQKLETCPPMIYVYGNRRKDTLAMNFPRTN
ncbi:hypothetical protein GLYMA_U031201v4 [Glycine max]|nr:hypothetical protein GLYMA_U031201v4 [Glycine max]KAH1162574.1 hypothetical protein GYH30_001180 [Glycine max]